MEWAIRQGTEIPCMTVQVVQWKEIEEACTMLFLPMEVRMKQYMMKPARTALLGILAWSLQPILMKSGIMVMRVYLDMQLKNLLIQTTRIMTKNPFMGMMRPMHMVSVVVEKLTTPTMTTMIFKFIEKLTASFLILSDPSGYKEHIHVQSNNTAPISSTP
eukprot:m.95021 g.95021  ORF g.95021 m.95021 type:complete len:160 (-) comp16579_c0_seq2:26-505(-)